MLNYWLSIEENRMPPNASHQVGVGCVVVKDDKKLLVVQEKVFTLTNLHYTIIIRVVPIGIARFGSYQQVWSIKEKTSIWQLEGKYWKRPESRVTSERCYVSDKCIIMHYLASRICSLCVC